MADAPPTFSSGQRFRTGLSVMLGLAAALALVVMVNYLAVRHHWQGDLTGRSMTRLSPQTLRVLDTITNDIAITIFFDTRSDDSSLYQLLQRLLAQYAGANSHVKVRTIDPTRQPGDAELALASWQLGALKNRNFVVLEALGRPRVIYDNELGDFQIEMVAEGPPPQFTKSLRAFRGEVAMTTALFNAVNPRRYKVAFTTGHGEHDPDRSNHPHGYAKFAQAIREKSAADIERVSLLGTNDMPADLQLLVIAGPQQEFTPSEAEKIERFLRGGGRLLALLPSPVRARHTGLEEVLAKWNLGIGDTVILDPPNTPKNNTLLTAILNTNQPIARALAADGESARLLLVLPRPVGMARSGTRAPDAPDVQPIAFTSKDGIEVADLRNGVPYPNPANDATGAFPLITAVEQGSVPGVSADRGATRIVATGDSFFLDNELIESPPANRTFGALAVTWLLDRPHVLLEGLVPQPVASYRVLYTHSQMRVAMWVLLGAIPGGVLLLGALVAWRRRH